MKLSDSAPFRVRTWKNVTCLRDHFAQYDFKKPPPFRNSAMKLCFIQCYPYLSHVRWRNFYVTSSLALDNCAHINVKRLAIRHFWQWIVCTIKKGNGRYLCSGVITLTLCAARIIIFQRENLNDMNIKKNAIKRWGHRACLRVSRLLNWGIFAGCALKIRIPFLQN